MSVRLLPGRAEHREGCSSGEPCPTARPPASWAIARPAARRTTTRPVPSAVAPARQGGMPQYPLSSGEREPDHRRCAAGLHAAGRPAVSLRLSYNHRDGRQPQTMTYGNVGPLWTFNSLAYVTDNFYQITPPYPTAAVYLRGHGMELYEGVVSGHPLDEPGANSSRCRTIRRATNGTCRTARSKSTRCPIAPASLLRPAHLPDRGDRSAGACADLHLRQLVPAGRDHRRARPGHDPRVSRHRRSVAAHQGDRSRSAASRRSPTTRWPSSHADRRGEPDVAFLYGTGDFIVAMTTPYGTTTFRQDANAGGDPCRGRGHRSGRRYRAAGVPLRQPDHWRRPSRRATCRPGSPPPTATSNQYNSLYWDKLAMALYPGDLTQGGDHQLDAERPTSAAAPDGAQHSPQHQAAAREPGLVSLSRSERRPRITALNWGRQPALIGRVLDDGGSQITPDDLQHARRW